MTKKDYIKAAALLKSRKPTLAGAISKEHYTALLFSWEELVEDMARMFSADNPRFDFDRFYKACTKGE